MDENLIYVQFVYHLTTFPRDMYIHLHTIGLTGVTELGTVTFHLRQIGADFTGRFLGGYCCFEKNIFEKSFKSSLSLFVPSFRFF